MIEEARYDLHLVATTSLVIEEVAKMQSSSALIRIM